MIITDNSFKQDVLQAETPVLLFFTGEFCGPSLVVADFLNIDDPIFDRIKVARVDVEKCPLIAQTMNVKGTPTLMLLHEGNPVINRIGTHSEDEFFTWLEDGLSKC